MSTVLVVDDSQQLCSAVAAMLKKHGYCTSCVGNGPDALAWLRLARADVVLLDVSMPGMDGIQVLREIRANPQTAHIPVIVFSAINDPALIDASKAAGADAYWIKAPYSFEDFPARLQQSLSSANRYRTSRSPVDLADLSARRTRTEVMNYGQKANGQSS